MTPGLQQPHLLDTIGCGSWGCAHICTRHTGGQFTTKAVLLQMHLGIMAGPQQLLPWRILPLRLPCCLSLPEKRLRLIPPAATPQ